MASQTDVDMRQAATPSKMAREGASGGAACVSTPGPRNAGASAMDISSPDLPSFSLRQKQPPLLSSKPRSSRKVSSLFSSDTGGEPGPDDAGAKKWMGDGDNNVASAASVCRLAAASPEKEAGPRWESQRGGSGSTTTTSTTTGTTFTSPVRASKDAPSNRFTPQRNLGGLFASPLPPAKPQQEEDDANDEEGAGHQRDDGSGVSSDTADLILAVPRPPSSPKRDQPAADETAIPAPATQAAATAAAPPAPRAPAATTSPASKASPLTAEEPTSAMAATAVVRARVSPLAALAPAPVAATAPAATKLEAASVSSCRCGCFASSPPSSSSASDVCCVSNEAFKGDEPMCTLEILVKRDRIGVSALASWRVAELKRRLVHLRHFPADAGGPAGEEIALIPSFPPGSTPLEDGVRLDTLDADVTYKARRRSAGAPPRQPPLPSQQQLSTGSTEEHLAEQE